MKQLFPDLWQSKRYSSGLLNSHAYFLQRPDGNVLIYNTGNNEDLDTIEQLGGVRHQLLTHRDEAGESLSRIRRRFGSVLMFTEQEAAAISRYSKADQYLKETDHSLGSLHVLATPGHTSGSVCFVYRSPHNKTYLFTGDTFFQWNGEWATLVIEGAGGSKKQLANSLKKLKELKPDVVMSSGFIGDIGVVEPSEHEWGLAIDTEISRLEKD